MIQRPFQRQSTTSNVSRSSLFLLLLICLLTPGCRSAHVLLIPYPYASHVIQYSSIGKGLLERGYRVTILLSASFPNLEQVRNESGFRVVDYKITHPDLFSKISPNLVNILNKNPVEAFRSTIAGTSYSCRPQLPPPRPFFLDLVMLLFVIFCFGVNF
jgi:hypothetical protein